MNTLVKKKYGDLYKETKLREKELISLGFNYFSIWESDFKNY